MEALVVVAGGGQTRLDFGDEGFDPKKWRICSRRGCGIRFKRRAPCREARGQGRYCCRACKSIDQWEYQRRAPGTEPSENGHGWPAENEQDGTTASETPEPKLRAIAGGG